MKSKTEILVAALRILANDIQSPDDVPATCLREAAYRLEELQWLNESMQTDCDLWVKVGREKLETVQFLLERKEIHSKDWENQARQAKKERDEARAEVERLKTENQRLKNLVGEMIEEEAEGRDTSLTRPEPSRLEIAAMLKAGWFANRDADFNAADHGWWVEQADALIAAAREAK